jgi:hypothetical protein
MARKSVGIEKTNFLKNLILYYVGIGVIVLGYIFLSIGGANSVTSLTLGPVVLVIGYLIAMPVALLAGIHKNETVQEKSELGSAPTKQVKKV